MCWRREWIWLIIAKSYERKSSRNEHIHFPRKRWLCSDIPKWEPRDMFFFHSLSTRQVHLTHNNSHIKHHIGKNCFCLFISDKFGVWYFPIYNFGARWQNSQFLKSPLNSMPHKLRVYKNIQIPEVNIHWSKIMIKKIANIRSDTSFKMFKESFVHEKTGLKHSTS